MLRYRPYVLATVAVAVLLVPARAGEDCIKYLPADTEVVSTLNLRQILESDLGRSQKDKVELLKGLLNNAIQNNDVADKYLKSLGFDLFRDFNSITVAAAASADPEKILVILDGKFNPEKFQKTAEEAAKEYGDILKIVKVGNHTVWEVNDPNQDKTVYVSLANKSTLLATIGKTTMTNALAQAAGTKEPGLKKEVRKLIEATTAKQSFSFAGTGPGLAKLAEFLAEHAKEPQVQLLVPLAVPFLKTLAGVNASITVTKEIEFQVGIDAREKKAAEDLSSKISGAILMVRGMTAQKAKDEPRAQLGLEVLKTLRTSVEGTIVNVRGRISEAVLEKAVKQAGPGQ
jgi:hypothetical protein